VQKPSKPPGCRSSGTTALDEELLRHGSLRALQYNRNLGVPVTSGGPPGYGQPGGGLEPPQ
jgi:hypothetical protein